MISFAIGIAQGCKHHPDNPKNKNHKILQEHRLVRHAKSLSVTTYYQCGNGVLCIYKAV